MQRSILILLCFNTACEASKATDTGGGDESCLFEDGDRAPCVIEGYVWKNVSDDPAIFVKVSVDDPQGYLDITIDNNYFQIYPVENDIPIVQDLLYCEGGECVYSFMPHQYAEVDTNNLTNYRFVAVVHDWEGNASPEKELMVDAQPEF